VFKRILISWGALAGVLLVTIFVVPKPVRAMAMPFFQVLVIGFVLAVFAYKIYGLRRLYKQGMKSAGRD
jgi:hypothetical protein